jgi:TolA-binding protein
VAVMENRFNDAMKQQQQSLNVPVANVGQKLDAMSDDFRAVRESVLDMNTRLGKLDAKIADLQNLINTVRAPAAPPPGSDPNSTTAPGGFGSAAGACPPNLQAGTLYTSAYSDKIAGKYDIAFQEYSDYLKCFGNTDLAPTAQYEIGDIYNRKSDYTNAKIAFDAVLEKYPEGPKTPDARYMKAVCLVKLGMNDSAAREFREVYARYLNDRPEIAAKAKEQLRDMGLSVGPAKSKGRRN